MDILKQTPTHLHTHASMHTHTHARTHAPADSIQTFTVSISLQCVQVVLTTSVVVEESVL